MDIKKRIKKTRYLKVEPNLKNYNSVYKNFSKRKYFSELEWFKNGKLNAAYNAADRHASTWRKNKVALIWESAEGQEEKFTFLDLKRQSNRFANVLKKLGIKRGQRVFFFLGRVPALYIGFLGAIKTGAIAGTMFAAFGPKAIQDRLGNSQASVLVTDPALVKRVYKVKKNLPHLKKIIIVGKKKLKKAEFSYEAEMEKASEKFKVAHMKPTDSAFMLFTSGTTGLPKGVIHSHLAILHEHLTAKWVLDLQENDVYWCTADPGWVTGIGYSILGSWSSGATELVYEGRFDAEKWYELIEKHRVSIWYTAPTAIRMLMKFGLAIVRKYDLSSLRHLCSVGEPLNPEPIFWGLKAFNLPFHDNWWQTETGGMCIANFPCLDIKPGSMGKPVPGVIAEIINENGKHVRAFVEGDLALKPSWTGMMKEIWRRPKKYKSYFFKGWYISGDRAFKDKDGYFWFVGRADDVIKTAGERVGPFEVESALVEHPAIVEAGVIGKPDPLRGQIIKAFVTLNPGFKASEKLKKEIQVFVKKHLAGHAYPREIEFRKYLPKTRSGKIMRRMLRAEELGLPIGDTSTLEKF